MKTVFKKQKNSGGFKMKQNRNKGPVNKGFRTFLFGRGVRLGARFPAGKPVAERAAKDIEARRSAKETLLGKIRERNRREYLEEHRQRMKKLEETSGVVNKTPIMDYVPSDKEIKEILEKNKKRRNPAAK